MSSSEMRGVNRERFAQVNKHAFNVVDSAQKEADKAIGSIKSKRNWTLLAVGVFSVLAAAGAAYLMATTGAFGHCSANWMLPVGATATVVTAGGLAAFLVGLYLSNRSIQRKRQDLEAIKKEPLTIEQVYQGIANEKVHGPQASIRRRAAIRQLTVLEQGQLFDHMLTLDNYNKGVLDALTDVYDPTELLAIRPSRAWEQNQDLCRYLLDKLPRESSGDTIRLYPQYAQSKVNENPQTIRMYLDMIEQDKKVDFLTHINEIEAVRLVFRSLSREQQDALIHARPEVLSTELVAILLKGNSVEEAIDRLSTGFPNEREIRILLAADPALIAPHFLPGTPQRNQLLNILWEEMDETQKADFIRAAGSADAHHKLFKQFARRGLRFTTIPYALAKFMSHSDAKWLVDLQNEVRLRILQRMTSHLEDGEMQRFLLSFSQQTVSIGRNPAENFRNFMSNYFTTPTENDNRLYRLLVEAINARSMGAETGRV